MVQRALLDTRLAVRRSLERFGPAAAADGASLPLVLVALSGGADSLALAAALAAEVPRGGIRAGALVVDHGLQQGSATVAARAAAQAESLGLDLVLVRTVAVADSSGPGGGPEAAARAARYTAFRDVAAETGAQVVLTAHTRDDQAEQVLLGLARGSGVRTLAGIPIERGLGPGSRLVRPFLGAAPEVTRAVTEAACVEAGLEPWHDPHNADPAYTRVRVRHTVLPVLERELGPGVAAALARTADLARDDADALDMLAARVVAEALAAAGDAPPRAPDAAVAVSVRVLAAQPPALLGRAIRLIAGKVRPTQLHLEHVREVAALVTAWRGQGPVFVPRVRVTRRGGTLEFAPQQGSPRG